MTEKKADKKPVKGKKRGKYTEKLAVKGTFLEIMKAASKNANDKSAPKKKKDD